jgi:crossover junction endodeoxyribonuclease RuvC
MPKQTVSSVDLVKEFVDAEWGEHDKVIVGVDPGAKGAIAFIDTGTKDENGALVVDIPHILLDRSSGGTTSVIDQLSLSLIFKALDPVTHRVRMCAERAQARPTFGVGKPCPVCRKPERMIGNEFTGVRIGLSYGPFLFIPADRGWPFEDYHSLTWKKAMGLTSDKERSRHTALRIFPGCADLLSRKKDEGRAEALLLAEFHRRKIMGEVSWMK